MQSTSPLKSNTLVETNPLQPSVVATPTQPPSTKSTRELALQTNDVIVYKPGLLARLNKKPVTKTIAATPKPKEKTKSVSIFVKFAKLVGCFSKPKDANPQETNANKESYEFENKESFSNPIPPEPALAELPGEITSLDLPQLKPLPEKALFQIKEAKADLESYYKEAGIQKRPEDIDAAIKEFQRVGCDWSEMKKNF